MAKILCYAPNNAVWRYTFPQAQWLDLLKTRGDTIDYVACDREYSEFCMSMPAHGVTMGSSVERKAAVCQLCQRQASDVTRAFGFAEHRLSGFVTPQERKTADELTIAASYADLRELTHDGIPIGKFALYETMIQSKALSTELAPTGEALYRSVLRNTWLAAIASDRMIDTFRPDVGVTYHTPYCYNRAFQHVLEKRGVPVFFLNASMNTAELDTHLIAARGDTDTLFQRLLADWTEYAKIVSHPEDIASVGRHLLTLMAGKGYAYSAAMTRTKTDPFDVLGVPKGRKILLAALSSYDELAAAEAAGFSWTTKNDLFPSQVAWLEWLFEEMRSRSDCHLIVRVHPREYGLGQAGVSDHVKALEAVFATKPANVSINTPTQSIPIYALLMRADVVLISWSSVGMEAGMLGIPVVSYFGDVLMFPRSLTFEPRSTSEYRSMLSEALAGGWSSARARAFFRWAVLMLVRTRVGLSGSRRVDRASRVGGSLAGKASRRLRRMLTPWSDAEWDLMTRERSSPAAESVRRQVDGGLETVYCLPDERRPANPGAEIDAIGSVLTEIAAVFEASTGQKAARLRGVAAKACPTSRDH